MTMSATQSAHTRPRIRRPARAHRPNEGSGHKAQPFGMSLSSCLSSNPEVFVYLNHQYQGE